MMKLLTILIDGYNVSRKIRGLRPEDGVALPTARDNLLHMVRQQFRNTPHQVIVVFDGNGEREVCLPIKGLARGRCIFTQRGTSADDVIVRLSQESSADGYDVVTCTDDLEVRQNTAPHGAKHASVADLSRTLNAPDKYRHKQFTHARHVRKTWETDDGEPARPSRKGNPRRPPKKPRGRGERAW